MSTKKEQEDLVALETRKVKALEKIANSLDSLTIWFEDINKNEWSDRIQFYLSEFHKTLGGESKEEEKPTSKKK